MHATATATHCQKYALQQSHIAAYTWRHAELCNITVHDVTCAACMAFAGAVRRYIRRSSLLHISCCRYGQAVSWALCRHTERVCAIHYSAAASTKGTSQWDTCNVVQPLTAQT
jgi:hypothetical protein